MPSVNYSKEKPEHLKLNRRAIIIGASSGIGRAITLELISLGYIIGVTGRRAELLEEIRLSDPLKVHASVFDITDGGNVSKMDELVSRLGGLDLCIISAGTGEFNAGLEFETELRIINTNIKGFTELADWAYSYFVKQGHGHLAGITSIGGIRGNPLAPAYNASKAFQINYLEGLRLRSVKYRRTFIITDIRPGFVDTDMAKGEGLFWVSTAEKAARQIIRAIRKKRKIVYITRRWRLK
jgi:short-subunit dehydrogenase